MGFKVVIVGGSISGLSLANMLEKFDIDYVLLEAYDGIAPQLGASIGLLPSGLRILEQLGCYERIQAMAGDCYYQQIFIDRQMLLQVLFDKLKFKDRVLTKKRVTRVDMAEGQVNVHTADGSVYSGDVVVGADGVHSAIREEMWRNAKESNSGLFQPDEESGLQAVSKCIFGISKRPTGLPATPLQINAFFKDCNYMILSAPGDRLYWFLFTEMDKAYGKDIPKFTKEDERRLAEQHFGDRVTNSTTFQDIYNNGLHTTLVALEDHVFPRWHYRRIIIIGDAAHKVHPISAQGGNGAMESAAVLVNTLRQRMGILSADEKLSEDDIESIFADVQAKRFSRAVDAVNQGRRTTAASIKDTLFSRLFVDWFFPRFGQRLIFRLVIKNTETGPVIDGLPVPKRYEDAISRHKATIPKSNWMIWTFGSFGAAVVALTIRSALK
ncbi:hypothetical protein NLJ89_g8326 [Agrocybe chaxingu]|uniref:FAD-binding domain-containing protein n=1 Tax=Agrocybe chaxingu TaxID=84603 RepID=A0A9W8JXN7_9AGAR|nr:hypothetical protein NLJ89_g8326 [Agrocybe chaxingu]